MRARQRGQRSVAPAVGDGPDRGITHILVAPGLADFARGDRHFGTDALLGYTTALVAAGCGAVVHSEVMTAPRSRTMPTLEGNSVSSDVVEVDTANCHL